MKSNSFKIILPIVRIYFSVLALGQTCLSFGQNSGSADDDYRPPIYSKEDMALILGVPVDTPGLGNPQVGYISHPKGHADLRAEPNSESKLIRQVSFSEILLCTQSVGEYYKIEFPDGENGYIHWKSVWIMDGDSIMSRTDEIIENLKNGGPNGRVEFLAQLGQFVSWLEPVKNKETRALVLMKLVIAEAPISDGEGRKIYDSLVDDETLAVYNQLVQKAKAGGTPYKPGPLAEYFLQFGRNVRDSFARSAATGSSASGSSDRQPICIRCQGRGEVTCGPHSSNTYCITCVNRGWRTCPICYGDGRSD